MTTFAAAKQEEAMLDNLKKYHVVLASNSPRRRMLLEGLDIPFEVKVLPDIDESYPPGMPLEQVAEHIACEKAAAYKPLMADDELIITADTIVIVDESPLQPPPEGEASFAAAPLPSGEGLGVRLLGKPRDKDDAVRMLHMLSDHTHRVVTGVCLTAKGRERRFSATTDVTFKHLTDEEIAYYLEKYRPYDKAGAYGVQEWIGYVGVSAISGSFYNVMGFPVQRVYNELAAF